MQSIFSRCGVLRRFANAFPCIVITSCLFGQTPALAEWIYWADNDADTINRLRIGQARTVASGPEVLIQTEPNPQGLVIDAQAGTMYWSDIGRPHDGAARGRIYRANLDGSNQETLYTASLPRGQESTGQLALDRVRGQLSWIDEEGGRIRRIDFGDSNAETVIVDVVSLGTALEVDAFAGHLYFTTGSFVAGTAKIERVNLDGSNRDVIADQYGYSIALDIMNEDVYAADWDGDRITRVAFDGTGLIDVVPFVRAPRDVQVFGGHLYYPNIRSNSWQWVRAELDGSNPVVLYEVPRADGPLDMIQFVVVPEPGWACWLAPLLFIVLGNRRLRTKT